MKIVQVKGGCGSGKTTIAKQLLALNGVDDGDVAPLKWTTEDGKWKNYGMLLRNVGWILIGNYKLDKAMGGTDTYPTKVELIKQAITLAIPVADRMSCEVFGIVFEGMMISTIKATFYDHLLELEKEHGIEPLFVILQTTPDGCMYRLKHRPSKRKKKTPQFWRVVENSCRVLKNAITYDQRYVRWIDVENTPEDEMLERFLEAVGDVELLEEL